jgi:hypothetical protein
VIDEVDPPPEFFFSSAVFILLWSFFFQGTFLAENTQVPLISSPNPYGLNTEIQEL